MYHSALAKGREIEFDPISKYSVATTGSVAFVHDLSESVKLPEAYDDVDVFYSDVPWPHGYNEFLDRANVASVVYSQFLANLKIIVNAESRPVVLVAGKQAATFLEPHRICETKLNGDQAFALVWNDDFGLWRSADEILDDLSDKYSCVGDFCCGYGRAGKAFHDKGKRFVMSDINPKCIGGVCENISKG